MYTFELPEIGEGVLEGEVVKWLVAEGDVVSQDQPVCEVMTDKANVEISIRDGGQVMKLHAEEGDVVKIHSPLMDIDKNASGAASTPPTPKSAPEVKAPQAPKAPVATAKPALVTPPPVITPPTAVMTSAPVNRTKTLATPAVRRTAREMGVDLKAVPGSGKDGRVTKDDVLAFASGASANPALAPAAVPQSKAIPSGQEERIKIIGLRRKIAEQMVKAYRTAPHFTYVDEVDMSDLVAIRRNLKAPAAARGVHLTYLPFIMKALCKVFQEFPNFNANIEEDPLTLVVKGDVNIGIAVDAPQGLFVPVIKNVEQKSILQIAAEVADLTARTRAGKVQLDELQGGTFTITSVGNIGGMFATPIINHPEVAILGVNKIHQRPVVRNGEIVIRDMLYLSPSFDHRCIDGAVAARFVSALKQQLQNPGELLMELS
jgi:pyruvate dehydrogenase E2 component (dihydrolipoamide acetyltransferase)